MGKSTISMAIFNSFLYVYQRVNHDPMVSLHDPKQRQNAKTLRNPRPGGVGAFHHGAQPHAGQHRPRRAIRRRRRLVGHLLGAFVTQRFASLDGNIPMETMDFSW